MSRCYPYRPTSCVRSGAGAEALIKTIKLQREKEKPITHLRKEKKRERKERKERKEKKKYEKCCLGEGYVVKGSDDEEAERVGKSSLTDEHDEPVCAQNLCYLSDGTQSNRKRKRDLPPSNGITVHRNKIRIRLPSTKHGLADASPSEEQSCSTSGRAADSVDQQKEIVSIGYWRTRNIDGELTPTSDSVRKENIAQYGAHASCSTAMYENELQGKESLYKALIDGWIPLSQQNMLDDTDGQEWIFGTNQRTKGSKGFKVSDDISSHQSRALWPSARYLPEADVFALPYTVPL